MRLWNTPSKLPDGKSARDLDPKEIAAIYHRETKHHFHRYARSLGFMDWDNQPDPFRRYAGAPFIELPLSDTDESPAGEMLYTSGSIPVSPLTIATLGLFFERSLAISAWKEYRGNRWALRINPSSGNLHPTESYAVLPALNEISDQPGVYHYAPREHGLECRTRFSDDQWKSLSRGFPDNTFFVGLTSIFWREAWKYGERAFRYCQIDLGHAIGTIAFAARSLGWEAVVLSTPGDATLAALLGLDRKLEFHADEPEHPETILAIVPSTSTQNLPAMLPLSSISEIAAGQWFGKANRLSKEHADWPIIDEVAAACQKPETPGFTTELQPKPDNFHLVPPTVDLSAHEIFKQRRSAVSFDGVTGLTADQFFRILARTMPWAGSLPWNTFGGPVFVNLVLFVHRVEGLEPGLYFLVRNPAHEATLREKMLAGHLWEKPKNCPDWLPLYLLDADKYQRIAARISCGQDIAGDSAFSLGMIAEFESPIARHGAWLYRRLFWETGLIGQVLYLEAEAAGVRGTGIGCFFDDPVHSLLGVGVQGMQFQSLYHFTIGGPTDDGRLTTLPAYPNR
ncbi:MAG: SagB/ThcOx family dehydrogenase [Acidobacteria bacterium]|nr:SagB/ThcOx family dehydrogenase [Acidobacteriota bacterium]